LEVALPVESGNAAFSFNSKNMTNIFASQESYINWVVDNYHDQVVNNAIAAGLITSDIPREELFYVLVDAMKSGGMNQVVYSLDVPLSLESQPQEIRAQFARNVGPMVSPKSYRSDDDFVGPPTLEEWESQQENGGFDWDQFSDIFQTAAGVFTSIWGAVSGGPSGPPSDGNNQLPSPPVPPDNTNMILIIAGIAMVLVLVIVLMNRK